VSVKKQTKFHEEVTSRSLLECFAFVKGNNFPLVGEVRGAGQFLASSLVLFEPFSGINNIFDERS
jgi:hypothetical protein